MKKFLIVALAAMLFPATIVHANAETPRQIALTPTAQSEDGSTVEVEWGDGYVFSLDSSEPVIVCVLSFGGDLSTKTFEGLIWIRNLDGRYMTQGIFNSRMSGEFEDLEPGECIP